MTLPIVPLPTETTEDGTEIRGLSRTEVIELFAFTDRAEKEAFLISKGTGVSLAEAAKWMAATGYDPVEALLLAILRLSGIAAEGEQDPQS